MTDGSSCQAFLSANDKTQQAYLATLGTADLRILVASGRASDTLDYFTASRASDVAQACDSAKAVEQANTTRLGDMVDQLTGKSDH